MALSRAFWCMPKIQAPRMRHAQFFGDRALWAPLRDHGQQQAAAGRPFAADTLGEGGMWRGAAWYQQRPSPQRLPELQMRVSLQQSARTRRTRARSRVAHLPTVLRAKRTTAATRCGQVSLNDALLKKCRGASPAVPPPRAHQQG